MAGVFAAIACGSKDAFLNPAVTLGFAISSGDYSNLVPLATAQMLGALWAQSSFGCIICLTGRRLLILL